MIDPSPQPYRPHIVIVTPALASANNGNWQTAERWQRLLSAHFHCRIVQSWPDKFANQDDVMLALHARRSADSIAAWHSAKGGSKLVVVLTGTDLYRDIQTDATAQASLAMASRLIVLQDRAPLALPTEHQFKCQVIFQSTTSQPPATKTVQHLRALMVGHLRDEKSPATLLAAVRMLTNDDSGKLSPDGCGKNDRHGDIYIDHIGAPLDAALGKAAEATAAACSNYRYLGAVPHNRVRRQIGRAHVLVHASRMEGGAHVIMEAACSGTPVIASRIDGNIGMLGEDYAGYFELGDAAGLVKLLVECRLTQNDASGLLARLQAQIAIRAPLFAPEAEADKLTNLMLSILQSSDHCS